jgi:homocysteine S-methyltransferase
MFPNLIDQILHDYPLMILDGALATELERRGCDLRDHLWSAKILLESPELIRQVHADYFVAGADCATTASYQATFEGFARRGLSRAEAADLMRLSAQLAVEARDEFWADPAHRAGRPKPLVAASIGSYGAFLADGSEYSGDYGLNEQELMDFHRPRLAVLAATDADLLACETIPSLLEAQALARLLGESPGRNAWISFSCRDGAHTSHGERLADCAARLDPYDQIVAIGINCTPPRYVPDLIGAARSATTKPILAYPNSGETYLPKQSCWAGDRDDARSYAGQARLWFERGARIIGGCCRTTPQDIQAIATWARHGDLRWERVVTLS